MFMSEEQPFWSDRRDHEFRNNPGRQNKTDVGASAPRATPGRVWHFAFIAVLTAASIGWIAGEAANQAAHWESYVQAVLVRRPDLRNQLPSELLLEPRHIVQVKSASLSMGTFGAAIGLSLGAAGGLARRSTRATIACGLIGFLSGAAVGTTTPLQLIPFFYRSAAKPPNPVFPLLVQTALYGPIGIVGGVAFGFALTGPGGAGRGAIAGVLGAILGVTTFNITHTIAWPLEWDLAPLPGKSITRLLAHLSVALTFTTCILLATDERVPIIRRRKTVPKENADRAD